jgi:hypothetical protein
MKLLENIIKKIYRVNNCENDCVNNCKNNCNCDNNDEKNNCNLVQNYQLLEDQTPTSLKNLPYGIYPENINYNNLRLNYNRLQNYYPSAIFYPRCKDELGYLVKNMVMNKLDFSTRCGARAYEPASLSNGFVIDVGKFNKIKINIKAMTVSVGSGVRLGDLINELAKKRLIMTTGDSSCVGVSGLSLAGGKGYLTRLYGMVCDNIVSAKIVNHTGKEIKASDKSNTNTDLLYALKGSGHGSYGIVTELKFNIHSDIYCNIVTLTWTWDSTTVLGVIEFYQQWIIDKPDNITTDLNMTYSNGTASFYIKFFKYYRTKKDFDDFMEMKDFITLIPNSKPTVTIDKGYYTQLLDVLVKYNTGTSYPFSKIKSTMVFDLIVREGINLMINSIDQLLLSSELFVYQINFSQLGGAVSTNTTSCFYSKNARFVITILNTWVNPDLTEQGKAIPNDLYNSLVIDKYTSKFCLPNMIDYNLSDYLESYYGTNQDKLITIKNKYDPKNIFNWKQSIPLLKA